MTQVALQGAVTGNKWATATATPTVNTPAGSSGHQQLLILTWDSGDTVVAPAISGWTLRGQVFQTGTANRLAAYTRVLSAGVAAGVASVTFSAAVYGQYECGSFNGVIGAITFGSCTGFLGSQTVPATTSASAESLRLAAMASANWPRTIGPVSGYTEAYDDYCYTASQGTALAVEHKAVSAGAVASTSWTIYDTDGTTASEDQTNYLSVVVSPPSTSGTITVTADFPVATAITLSRAGSGSLAASAADTVTATVLDQNGAPIRNAQLVAGAVAGGVFTVGAIPLTNAAGVASFTVTGAVVGTAALVVSVGGANSNALDISVAATGPVVTSVGVTPATAAISANGTQQFSAVVSGTGGVEQDVTWEVVSGGGSVSQTGLYTAPAASTTATVRARALQNQAVYNDSVVTVSAASTGTVTMSCIRAGVPLSNQSFDYVVKAIGGVLIASGTAITNGSGMLAISVPGEYVGQQVMSFVENVSATMVATGKVYRVRVLTVH